MLSRFRKRSDLMVVSRSENRNGGQQVGKWIFFISHFFTYYKKSILHLPTPRYFAKLMVRFLHNQSGCHAIRRLPIFVSIRRRRRKASPER